MDVRRECAGLGLRSSAKMEKQMGMKEKLNRYIWI